MVVDGKYPCLGGAEIQVQNLTREFTRLGHHVDITSLRLSKELLIRERIEGIEVERIAYPRIKVMGAIVLCFKYGWKLLKERNKYDIVHIHIAKNLAIVTGLLKPFLKAKIFVKVSGAYEFDGGVMDLKNRNRINNRIKNYFIKKCDYIQSISAQTKENLLALNYPKEKIVMITNGVDIHRFKPNENPREGICNIMYVGRLREYKGLNYLLEAWSEIIKKHRAHLFFVGDGSIKNTLKKQCKDLGICGSVKFLGMVDDVPAMLKVADIYVQPSLNEGLPNSVLEAMSMGLPIVATKISGNEDIVIEGENGFLVPPKDSNCLENALLKLIENQSLRKKMGRRSRTIIEENYAFEKVVNKLENIYSN